MHIPSSSRTATNVLTTKIIQKNFEARGGKDFSSVKTIVQEGSAKAPMFSMDFRLLMSIPDKIRYEITAGGNEITTIINGDRGWQIDSVAKPLSAQNREIIKSILYYRIKNHEWKSPFKLRRKHA